MKQAWIEKTEQYLDNEMSASERLLFEQEMAMNEELSSYVSLYREIETVMHDNKKNEATEEALTNSLKKLNASYFNQETRENSLPHNLKETTDAEQKPATSPQRSKRKIRYRMLFAVAAAIAGIIVIAVTWFPKDKEANPVIAGSEKTDTIKSPVKAQTDSLQKSIPSNLAVQNNSDTAAEKKESKVKAGKKQEELFAANFEPDSVPDVTEGPLEDAFNYYSDKNYGDAAQEFSSANPALVTRGVETDPKASAFYADYYAGISYLEEKQNGDAKLKLESAVTKSPDESFRVKAEWYLALAYLRTGDVIKADELLTKISENTNETAYKLKATRLLAALK
jgi:hypothetical protein